MSTTPRCGNCRRPVIAATTRPGLQRILLDPEPTVDGSYELDFDAVPTVSAVRRRPPGVPNLLWGPLYTCHWETCPANNAGDGASRARTAAPSADGSGR